MVATAGRGQGQAAETNRKPIFLARTRLVEIKEESQKEEEERRELEKENPKFCV